MLKHILYEQPLNERVRVFLRLEQLFKQIQQFRDVQGQWHSRIIMTGLSQILEILNRSDFKTEILKELERNQISLAKHRNTPGIDINTLDATLNELNHCYQNIIQINGQLGQFLTQNEILTGLVKRNSLVGGLCSFDLPLFQYWLNLDENIRKTTINSLFDSLNNIQMSISLLLTIIRQSTFIEDKVADNGFYQQNLKNNLAYQMVRVLLPAETDYFAEISAGKHRFSIRFLTALSQDNSSQTSQATTDLNFQLGCCAI